MICGQCFESITKYVVRNNIKLCESCLHNAQPWKKKRCTGDSCAAPTLQDLKKKWEKK